MLVWEHTFEFRIFPGGGCPGNIILIPRAKDLSQRGIISMILSHREFIDDLSSKCANQQTSNSFKDDNYSKRKERTMKPTVQEFHRLMTNDLQSMDFEHVVLEQVLSNISSRFSRHVWLTKPALELLLLQISQDPSGSMLRRLLAFRKSLGEFESGVQQGGYINWFACIIL